LLGKIASEQLVEQEKVNKQLYHESKKLRRNFDLAQAANLDLEKKVAELAEALGQCQDGKKITEESLERSKKDFEKLQKTHDDDLSSIENLRKDHDKSSKVVEDLRHNNADLAKTLSNKEQKIQDLERALAEQREASGKDISEITNKLHLLFKEYEKSLMNFGVHPAPLPADISLPYFMSWIEIEFKALPEVITSASDFAAAFSVETILKLLHNFDCADLVKSHEKLPQFPDASSTSRLRPNEDVLAIKTKYAREFWLPAGGKLLRTSPVLNLPRLVFLEMLLILANLRNFFDFSDIFSFAFFSCSKRRNGERALHCQSLLPKMKKMTSPTQMGRTLATAATTAVMAIIPPNMGKVPRRLTSQAKH
jgi:predicted  nucleic acid-binding Zn-ribbon protein